MAMTDREILELAGKAYGFKCWRSKHGYLNVTRPDGSTFTACYWPAFDAHTGEKNAEPTLADGLLEGGWTPLYDDGDAFRLAIKLGVLEKPDFWNFLSSARFAHQEADDATAYRRAIVTAAAIIGKQMP